MTDGNTPGSVRYTLKPITLGDGYGYRIDRVEVVGVFDTRDAAREYMIATSAHRRDRDD